MSAVPGPFPPARLLAVLGLLLAALPGCTRERAAAEPPDSALVSAALDGATLDGPAQAAAAPAAPAPAAPAQAAPPQVTPAQVTPAQFGGLRWLAGTWRGRMPDGKYFYERYAFANDSTIAVSYFADSTLARQSGADSVVLRGGRLGFDRATAVRVDDTGVDFAMGASGESGFVWSPRGRAGWVATLRGRNAAGRPYTVVYRMEPYTPTGG
jgi:hypothetical protein